ncbi:hypothetical protein F5887DRAFT_864088, partial [Amanita rubescens]
LVERLMKDWTSPVYAFFHPKPKIEVIQVGDDKRYSHVFRCRGKGCKATIRRFLDTKDSWSTGNMRKHVRSCWGLPALEAADSAANAAEVRTKIVPGILRDGSITEAFERKGKGKTYSIRAHSRAEIKAEIVRWVCTSLRPFTIVSDEYFLSIVKTGRPEYYVPTPETVSRDVRLVFARTRQRIAKLLSGYDGRLSFTTDAWTSPNH